MEFTSNWGGFGGPFNMGMASMQLFNLVLIILWVVILVDCARRKFTNDIEKICWIVAMVVAPLVGSIAYLAVVKYSNPSGIMKKDGTLGSLFKKEETAPTPVEPQTPSHTPTMTPTPNTPMVTPSTPTSNNTKA